jgi:hypothetical protein
MGKGQAVSSRVMRIVNMNFSVLVYSAYRFMRSSKARTVQIGGIGGIRGTAGWTSQGRTVKAVIPDIGI